jgi:Tetracyclin repressor-like, C-terminal domain
VRRRVFPGGCFFVSAAAELGARPGRVRDRVAEYQQQWRGLLGTAAHDAAEQGELPAHVDPDQLAFEVGAILAGANVVAVLHDVAAALDRAGAAIRHRLAG